MKWIRPFLLGVVVTALLNIPIYLYLRDARVEGVVSDARTKAEAETGRTNPKITLPERNASRRKPNRQFPDARDSEPGEEGGAVASSVASIAPDDLAQGRSPSAAPGEGFQSGQQRNRVIAVAGGTSANGDVVKILTAATIFRVIDGVLVPNPSVIFGLMDNVGQERWAATQRPFAAVAKPIGYQAQQALYLGTVIAEGFVAVEAQDREQVKLIGRSVISLSQALGVRNAVVKRAQAIISGAEAGEWKNVRTEMDGTLNQVKQALVEIQSPELADLIALGGWVRGAEAVCLALEDGNASTAAKLLSQRVLVEHFERKLAAMKARLQAEPLVVKARTALKDVKPLIQATAADDSAHRVKRIREIVTALVEEIQSGEVEEEQLAGGQPLNVLRPR